MWEWSYSTPLNAGGLTRLWINPWPFFCSRRKCPKPNLTHKQSFYLWNETIENLDLEASTSLTIPFLRINFAFSTKTLVFIVLVVKPIEGHWWCLQSVSESPIDVYFQCPGRKTKLFTNVTHFLTVSVVYVRRKKWLLDTWYIKKKSSEAFYWSMALRIMLAVIGDRRQILASTAS